MQRAKDFAVREWPFLVVAAVAIAGGIWLANGIWVSVPFLLVFALAFERH
jgi:hypothetical protein